MFLKLTTEKNKTVLVNIDNITNILEPECSSSIGAEIYNNHSIGENTARFDVKESVEEINKMLKDKLAW